MLSHLTLSRFVFGWGSQLCTGKVWRHLLSSTSLTFCLCLVSQTPWQSTSWDSSELTQAQVRDLIPCGENPVRESLCIQLSSSLVNRLRCIPHMARRMMPQYPAMANVLIHLAFLIHLVPGHPLSEQNTYPQASSQLCFQRGEQINSNMHRLFGPDPQIIPRTHALITQWV